MFLKCGAKVSNTLQFLVQTLEFFHYYCRKGFNCQKLAISLKMIGFYLTNG